METKKTKIIGIVSLVAIALMVVTATYAFFQAQVGDPAAVDISVNANTVDTFTFSVGDPISINLNQENFATGTGNQTSTTTASAMLTANNKTKTATEHYYMYLKITDNTYTYSIGEDTPEIILSVTDASGAAVEISGLTPVTATGANGTSVTGYDITNKSGLITILNNREITTTSTTTEKWNITITFINYDKDQSGNAGKSMSAKVMIQKDEYKVYLADYVKEQYTGTQGENNIYYHDGSLENGINDGSYRYAGGNYVLTSKATAAGLTSLYDTKFSSGDGLIRIYCGETEWAYGADFCSDSYYFTLRYDTANTQYTTYPAAAEKAVTDGYLQWGVKNYVCFGSDADTCPADNLYRIIGVFNNQVKLIKAEYANSNLLGTDGDYYGPYEFNYYYKGSLTSYDSYYWNYKATNSATNTWSTSLLNKTNLNTNFISYLNNIDAKWANMIAETTWKVGGNTYANIASVIAKNAYQNEITSPVTTNSTDEKTEYGPNDGVSKIGLMYASDYGFAASPSAWSEYLRNYGYSYGASSVTSVNWMYLGINEWTISRYSDDSSNAFIVSNYGNLSSDSVSSRGNGVRPVFYLESEATYLGGDGSPQSPIRLG